MKNVVCPLSGSSKVDLVEKIQVGSLTKLYKKLLNSDILSEFNGLEEIGLYHCIDSDLTFFYPFVTGSDLFYEKLQMFDWYYMDDKNEYTYAQKFVKESDEVLEIGSGKGAFAKKILTKKYTGLELSHKAVKIASSNGITVLNETVQSHAINNPNKYDVVCAFQVLEHVAEVYQFIESSILCLKPGGFLIYSVPSADSFSRYVPNFELDMPPHHVTRWSDKSLKNVSNYFPLNNVEIWHEPLQLVHKHFYAETILRNAFFNILNKKIKNVDFSIPTKAISLFSKYLGKVFASGLTSTELMPRGISVVTVYRKLVKEMQ